MLTKAYLGYPTKIYLGYPSNTIKNFITKNYNSQINTTPLTFTATGESSVQLTKVGSPTDISVEYSLDGFKTDPIPYKIGTKIELTDGQSVSMRAVSTNDTISPSLFNYYQFVMSGSIAASGNIQSLLDKTCQRMDVSESCYSNMFYDCTSLTQAPELPATKLAYACYRYMFYNCSSLTTAPELPATKLADTCYNGMFKKCSALTQVPKILPATILTTWCYANMFEGCTSLTQAPELPATTLTDLCYEYMFTDCSSLSSINVSLSSWSPVNPINATRSWVSGVKSSGTFTCPTALPTTLPETIGIDYIPEGWTIVKK